ncbi:ferrochelatase [Mumia zhuanghuii]|uniref:Coproporphyrin III ferrochelatase n=2 Tax=Mumia TaxID=1546255 RepID=A0ABW1QPA8_9ACTN|nr:MULTISPECIES: ferrochelatase [Mumia]KAA1420054.1 ferrochelatase [Mumia zhuanghuii]
MDPQAPDTSPYDAFLLISFGGPERPEDVVPFLENVTRGRGIPRERLVEVGEHYFSFGGRSPINDQNRDLIAVLQLELASHGIDLPIYWGNRNWDPYLTDTLATMRDDGVERAVCLFTSAYTSYSGCRQYRENLYDATTAAGDGAPRLDRVRHYFNHPGFVEPFVDGAVAALEQLKRDGYDSDDTRLVFVTHSIPDAMNEASGRGAGDDAATGGAYVREHRDVADVIAAAVAARTATERPYELVYCSRSGPPQVPWLEPDVNDHLETLADDGAASVVLLPIGFVSDHMEVIYDLDTEAKATAERLGLGFARVPTPGVDARFVTAIRELIVERAAQARGETPDQPVVGALPPSWTVCPVGCCANQRDPERPALLGSDR